MKLQGQKETKISIGLCSDLRQYLIPLSHTQNILEKRKITNQENNMDTSEQARAIDDAIDYFSVIKKILQDIDNLLQKIKILRKKKC